MRPGPQPRKRRLTEPFAWIILGAALVFASNLVSGTLGMVFLVLASAPFAIVQWELLLPVVIALAFVSPVGSFILLVGLARAVRRPVVAGPLSPAAEGEGAGVAILARPVNAYRIALLGAALALIGGLASASTSVARYLFPPSWPYASIQEYILAWTLALFVTGMVAAIGSLLAFIGVGLLVRDGSRRAQRV